MGLHDHHSNRAAVYLVMPSCPRYTCVDLLVLPGLCCFCAGRGPKPSSQIVCDADRRTRRGQARERRAQSDMIPSSEGTLETSREGCLVSPHEAFSCVDYGCACGTVGVNDGSRQAASGRDGGEEPLSRIGCTHAKWRASDVHQGRQHR